jgi:hypothetical protein
MADSKTRQYYIFQKYLPNAQTPTLHHLAFCQLQKLAAEEMKTQPYAKS